MRVMLDLNVILDFFLNRSPWVVEAAAIWQAHEAGLVKACLSSGSLGTLYYVLERQAGRADALQAIDKCVQFLELLPVDRAAILRARSLGGPDFEDDIQIACAMESQLDAIITRDATGFRHSPIAVLSPADVLSQIAAAPS